MSSIFYSSPTAPLVERQASNRYIVGSSPTWNRILFYGRLCTVMQPAATFKFRYILACRSEMLFIHAMSWQSVCDSIRLQDSPISQGLLIPTSLPVLQCTASQAIVLSVPHHLPSIKCKQANFSRFVLKVAFSQKGLMRLSFLQTDKPNYFPELEFLFIFHSKWLKSCQIRT